MTDPVRLLTFSTLYPNSVSPRHGIFVETRLRHLLASGGVEAKVVAPIPWFPLKSPGFGKYSDFAKVPNQENRHNINLFHPRYPHLPKIGMNLAPISLAAASMPIRKQLIRQGRDFDLIDAHYFYPDGVAAAFIAKQLGKPFVITARGSDVTLIPQYSLPRKMMLWAASQAAGIITVSAALKQNLAGIGVDPDRITVLRNGVDTELFRPDQREETRASLGISGPLLLSVGNLVESKGHDLVIRALSRLPEANLFIIGEGEERNSLEKLADSLRLSHRVHFLDNLPQEELRRYYSAADLLVLASSREGWANVLLEAMACGTPVVATEVGGNPEVVASRDAGRIVRERTPEALAAGIADLLKSPPEREMTRRYAQDFGWEEVSRGQKALFSSILNP